MRILALILMLMFSSFPVTAAKPAAAVAAVPAQEESLRISETRSIVFLGRTFDLKFASANKPVHSYEFFRKEESPELWLELVEFQIYPINPDGNEPIDFAKQVADAFKKQYPHMPFALLTEESTGAVILDFFYPTSTRKEAGKEFLEFNAFKFFRAADERHTSSFHYAKNIESISEARAFEVVSSEIRRTREELVSALAVFPIYRY
jgi:hypothetical protein